jgi:ubiquinone/menaquinone biosynthesis C-methylase UbiE
LPFASGTRRWSLGRQDLQHLARPDRALDEMVRVLKPGGTIVVDPGYETQVRSFLTSAWPARLGLRSWARAASAQGILSDEEVKRWVALERD